MSHYALIKPPGSFRSTELMNCACPFDATVRTNHLCLCVLVLFCMGFEKIAAPDKRCGEKKDCYSATTRDE